MENNIQDDIKDDFIATVSHELRTPLTSIKGFCETMLKSYDELDDEKKKHFLKIIKEQSDRLINLVENMLSVTKLNELKDTIVYKDVDVFEVIKKVIEVIKIKFPRHVFEIKTVPNLPLAFVDIDKFEQVLMNIVENACKYSRENSLVKIELSIFGNEIAIKIIDNGIGIKDTSTIFEKFSRTDNPLIRSVQGNGLGLYISKTLIEKMNGKIEVSSSDNGSTFTVFVPQTSAQKLSDMKIRGGK